MAFVPQLMLLIFASTTSAVLSHPQHSAHILKHVKSKTALQVQEQAAMELIRRLLPERDIEFSVKIEDGMRLNSFKVGVAWAGTELIEFSKFEIILGPKGK